MLMGFAHWLSLLPTFVAVLISALGLALLSVLLLIITHRFVPHPLRSRHNDLAGFVLAIIGVIYAVLLAFIAVAVWESYTAVGDLVQTEANLVDDLYRETISLPPDLAAALRRDLYKYTETVVGKEWPRMEAAMPPHLGGWRILDDFHVKLVGFAPTAPTAQAEQAEMLATLAKLYDARRGRFHAAESDLPAVVWWNLILGAAILIGFSCLFGAPSLAMHAVLVALLGASIGLVLVVIVLLDNPFLGASHVSVEPFQALSRAVMTMDYPKAVP
ncbi:bestrophin-like domain [Acidisoma sp. C75]